MESTIVGVLLGAAIAYLPRVIRLTSKAKSYKASLIAEIERCDTMARGFLEADIQSPSYRMPVQAWNKVFPELLGIGTLGQKDINKLYDFYIEVDSFNRGLDQTNVRIDDGQVREREYNRNKLKAENITKNTSAALEVISSIRTLIVFA